MKIERARNASRNVAFGLIFRLYVTVMPFVMRTIMIYFMGPKYLGLDGLFISVLQVLNLAELGVGNAMVYYMYKPIAEDDADTICALLWLYRKYYRIIGVIIAGVGVAIAPLIPKIIKDSIPNELNIYILYLLNLSVTVFSYWLFAYKNSLLNAYQREDIISKIGIIITSIKYFVQIIVLLAFRNYYVYLIVSLLSQLINNIVTALVVSKKFPDYIPRGKLDRAYVSSLNQRIRDVFTMKIGGTITSSADTIVISASLGLTVLTMYQNYYFILTSVIGFVTVIFNACLAGIGNGLIVDSEERNYLNYRNFTFLISWIATVCTTFFLCLYQPFIKLWVGEKYLFDFKVVILFCVYFYLYVIQQMTCVYKDAGGIWHSDRFRPLIAGGINLTLNISFVGEYGIYAILLSTIVSYLFIAMPWLIHNVFRLIFKKSPKEYVVSLIKNSIITIIVNVICYCVCQKIRGDGFREIIVHGCICFFISNCLLWIVYRKTDMYTNMCNIIKMVLLRKRA